MPKNEKGDVKAVINCKQFRNLNVVIYFLQMVLYMVTNRSLIKHLKMEKDFHLYFLSWNEDIAISRGKLKQLLHAHMNITSVFEQNTQCLKIVRTSSPAIYKT